MTCWANVNWRRASTLFLVAGWIIACESDSFITTGDTTRPTDNNSEKSGFGVSGLLFENNLIMWDRENDGRRSELFSQMYFTRLDASDFPVWGSFPSQFVVSGGVPRDGIPALVNPRFVNIGSDELDYLSDSDLVLGAVINGVAKAYPHNVLWWHEIVNDRIGGVGVIMTLCPLTGTGMLFRAPADADLVDRLELLPVIETTYKKWRELFPNSTILSRDTGIRRDYTLYPYQNYRDEEVPPLFGIRTRPIDPSFPPKHMVLGVFVGDKQKAYPFSQLRNNAVVNDGFNGAKIAIVSDLSAKLVLPFDRILNGQTLTFRLISSTPFVMEDEQTNSRWNILGRATAGPLSGQQLTQLPAHNAFWFAWSVFWPQSEVYFQ